MQLLPSEEGEFEIEAITDVLHNDNVKTIATTTTTTASITITGVILVF